MDINSNISQLLQKITFSFKAHRFLNARWNSTHVSRVTTHKELRYICETLRLMQRDHKLAYYFSEVHTLCTPYCVLRYNCIRSMYKRLYYFCLLLIFLYIFQILCINYKIINYKYNLQSIVVLICYSTNLKVRQPDRQSQAG